MGTAIPCLYKMECNRLTGFTNQLTGDVEIGAGGCTRDVSGEYERWIGKFVPSKYLSQWGKKERSPASGE